MRTEKWSADRYRL